MTDPRHERVTTLLRDHGPMAPAALRTRVEAEVARAGNRRRRSLGPGFRLVPAAGATLAIAMALALPLLGGRGAPTVAEVHAISADGPSGRAPSAARSDPELLAASFQGVDFPNWSSRFGWRAYGQSTNELDGRETRTVFYEHEGHEIAYTVVSGTPLDVPIDADRRRAGGLEISLLTDDHGHDIAVFERYGQTCVLSGHVERSSTLVSLASWSRHGPATS